MTSQMTHQFIFVTGMHRSGTSPLHHCLRDHPMISGFRNTGVSEDEGQHLQTVLPRGGAYGGPGRFARHPDAHMTEVHPLALSSTAEALFYQWSPHWDLSKPYLVEKTPITLTRTRLFQALFPTASFVVIIRHPIAVALATHNALASSGTVPDLTIADLIENWLMGYETFQADAPYLKRVCLVRYEDFVRKTADTLSGIYTFLEIPSNSCAQKIDHHADTRYKYQWQFMARDPQHQNDTERAMAFEDRIQNFGYSLRDWSKQEKGL